MKLAGGTCLLAIGMKVLDTSVNALQINREILGVNLFTVALLVLLTAGCVLSFRRALLGTVWNRFLRSRKETT